MTVSPIGGVSRATDQPSRSPSRSTGFDIPEGPGKATPAASLAGISLEGMLSLQEIEPPEQRNRRARRHAESMLDQLAALQLALLTGDADTAAMATLAALAGSVPQAADPSLQAAISAVAVRAAVELARHCIGAG